MLFRQPFLDGIRDGAVTLAFRRWRRPSVRAGGTLLTPAGQLSIGSVSEVPLDGVSETDARRAGYDSRDALLMELRARAEGKIYRIELGPLRPDPRVALREAATLDEDALSAVVERLRRFDARSAGGPWTQRTLTVIGASPGVRAGDLCRLLGQDRNDFKLNVRKLKSLGLTESLETGYRLSPRGTALLRSLEAPAAAPGTSGRFPPA